MSARMTDGEIDDLRAALEAYDAEIRFKSEGYDEWRPWVTAMAAKLMFGVFRHWSFVVPFFVGAVVALVAGGAWGVAATLIVGHVTVILWTEDIGQTDVRFEDFVTTVGRQIWLSARFRPGDLDLSNPATFYLIAHELVHVIQYDEEDGLFALKYVLLPFPTVWTWRGRVYELEGYTQQIIRDVRVYGRARASTLDWMIGQFTSANYAWMYPFPSALRSKLRRIERGVKSGHIRGLHPYRKDLLDFG